MNIKFPDRMSQIGMLYASTERKQTSEECRENPPTKYPIDPYLIELYGLPGNLII